MIQHNLIAMFGDRQLNITTKKQAKTTEKLSSGYKINRASDDAAGLTISEKMRWQIRGLNKGTTNSEDGISFCQVADGAMEEIHSMVQRARELCVQAANDTNTDADRAAIQKEISAISEGIRDITENTEFNTLKVFSKNRSCTVTRSVGGGSVETVSETVSAIKGTNYGLGEILGPDHISASSRMDTKITLTPDSRGKEWVVTGENIYSGNLARIEGKIGAADLTYNTITGLSNTSASGDVVTWSDTGGNTAKFAYDSDFIVGEKLLESADYYDSNSKYSADLISTEGSAPRAKRTYNCSWMDFSELGTKYQLSDLYDQGFNSVCATCSAFYSVLFTDGNDGGNYQTTTDGTRYSYENGSSKLLKIDISSCTSGGDIVRAIMDAAQNTPLTDHYTQYGYKKDNDSILYVFDNRDTSKYDCKGTFEPISRSTTGAQISSKTVTYTGTDGLTYTYDDRDMWIQSGALEHSGYMISKPWLSVERLGIDRISVSDYDTASSAIEICDSALAMVSDERSQMGAFTNRLQHTVNSNKNTSENTQAAESRIRDADIADEMVEYSKSNILAQAGQSVLAQANQMQQGLLQLLQ